MADEKYTKFRLKRGDENPFDATDAWFEDETETKVAPPPKDWAHRAARGIVADMGDRRGIKHELGGIDEETRAELVETFADIMRQAYTDANPTSK